MKRLASAASVLFLTGVFGSGLVGCSDDDAGGDDDTAAPDAAVGTPDAAESDDWSDIIASNWEIPPGGDGYYCASTTLTEDLYVGGFRPINPPGTHHTVLSFGPPEGPDDPGSLCNAGTENPNWVYASGVGTNELLMPTGVGVVIEAGQQVHVNLHLFNTGEGSLSGRSGVQIIKMNQADVVHEAELFLPGPFSFVIPFGEEYSFSGDCTIGTPQTIFALFPHMHQLGTHFKTEIVRAGGSVEILHDEPYDFEMQPFTVFAPTALAVGDKVRTTCTWINTTEADVSFGDKSTAEMCFSILMRYPRVTGGGSPQCFL